MASNEDTRNKDTSASQCIVDNRTGSVAAVLNNKGSEVSVFGSYYYSEL